MKAVTIRRHGGVEVLTYETIDDPVPGPCQVRVRVHAVALNHLDLWVREGLPGLKLQYPHLLGGDVAGVVESVGPGADPALVGKKALVNPGLSCGVCVACLRGEDNLCPRYRILGEHVSGGYAEYVVVPAANILPYPERLSWTEAAAVPLVFMTAWQMLVRRAHVQPGDVVLVHAAGSGIGSAAIQIAKLHGATVLATARGADKLERARALGADHTVDSTAASFLEAARSLTGKRGVDIVVEHVGQAVWADSLRALRWGGTLVTCGATSGWDASTDLRQIFYRQLQVLGSTMGSKADLFSIIPLLEAGRLLPVVDRAYPLAEAARAHERLAARENFGKVVLTVD